MAFRFENPYYRDPVQQKVEALAPVVDAWLKGQAGNKVITLAELRAGLPDVAADLTRPVVNGLCAALGLVIQNPQDASA